MVAGEVSGDCQGANLARALQAQQPNIQLFGAGGEQMRAAGVDLRVETTHFSSVGFLEPLRFLWPLRQALRQIREIVQIDRPDLAILIDYHGFNLALARFLGKQGIPIVYYFPPVVWIGSRFFCRPVAKATQLIITTFPGEAELYQSYGGHAVWFGHPLLDIVKPQADHRPIFAQLGLDDQRPLMAVLPGSRTQEVERLIRPMLAAARILQSRHPDLQFILPLAAPYLRPLLEAELERAGMTQQFRIITQDVYTCLSRCAVILTAAGTATLEATLLEVPMVVTYRLRALSHWLGRRVASTRFFALPNILHDDWVVPEILGRHVTAERLAGAVLELLEQPERATAMRARLREVRQLLGTEGAVDRAAAQILHEMVGSQPAPTEA